MNTSDKVLVQELELVRKDLHRVALVVESIRQDMRRLEVWQTTMDLTLKHSSESK